MGWANDEFWAKPIKERKKDKPIVEKTEIKSDNNPKLDVLVRDELKKRKGSYKRYSEQEAKQRIKESKRKWAKKEKEKKQKELDNSKTMEYKDNKDNSKTMEKKDETWEETSKGLGNDI